MSRTSRFPGIFSSSVHDHDHDRDRLLPDPPTVLLLLYPQNLGRRRYPTYWISPSSTLGARTFRRLRSNAHSEQHAEADEKATVARRASRNLPRSQREWDEQGNHRHVMNTEQRLGMGEGAGLRPDRERRLVEEGIFDRR